MRIAPPIYRVDLDRVPLLGEHLIMADTVATDPFSMDANVDTEEFPVDVQRDPTGPQRDS